VAVLDKEKHGVAYFGTGSSACLLFDLILILSLCIGKSKPQTNIMPIAASTLIGKATMKRRRM
jgi:hypothetical protein